MNVRFLVAAALLAFAAVLPTGLQAQAAPLDPVGEYEFTTQIPEMGTARGLLRIQNAEGGYTGSMSADAVGQLPVREIRVDGNRIILTFLSDQGTGTLVLELHGDHYMGSWSVGGMGGEVMATKRVP